MPRVKPRGGKECGDDGCGDVCGQCQENTEYCLNGFARTFRMIVSPCGGISCGSDGCGGSCGSWRRGVLFEGSCVCATCTLWVLSNSPMEALADCARTDPFFHLRRRRLSP